MTAMKEELLALLAPFGQQHVLASWDTLDAGQQAALAAEIRALDCRLIQRLHRQAADAGGAGDIRDVADRAASPPAFRLDSPSNRFAPQEARQRGSEALRAGQVGVILVAGGQGTRLGFDHPKGMFSIGPVSGKSLFQIHVEKVLAAARRYVVRIPLCLMTSPATHAETVEFFARHERFGLPEEDLHIFCQGTMPAVDAATGEILLSEPGHIALSPDGHGGTLAALARSGALEDLGKRGIRQVFYFQVDNPLVAVCGAEFIGYHLLSGSEMSSQVVAKREPLEKVGNVVQVDGRLRVIEYIDLPEEVARRRAADGSLLVWAGSIAVHVFDVAFLERMADRADALPFHVARKKVPYVDSSGRKVTPEAPNAIKFERFIFDLMPAAANAIVVEVDPAKGFAPLKNAPGEKQDTPEWVQDRMAALHAQWLRQAGAQVAEGVAVEVSPLFALDAEELAGKIKPGTRVNSPTYLG